MGSINGAVLAVWMKAIVISLLGAGCGYSAVFAWNRMPDRWLCDYGEYEELEAQAGSGPWKNRRLSLTPWAPLLSIGFTLCGAILIQRSTGEEDAASFILTLSALWCLLLICTSDLKFMIIPDQLVALLILLGAAEALRECVQGKVEAAAAYKAGAGSGLLLTEIWITSMGGRLKAGLLCGGAFWAAGRVSAAAANVAVGAAAAAAALRKPERRAGGHRNGEEQKSVLECTEAFGMGDVKFLFSLGVLFGAARGLFIFAAASLFAGGWLAVLTAAGRAGLKDERPFGPYLCIASALAALL